MSLLTNSVYPLGNPADRRPELVANDLENEFISDRCARDVYKVVVRRDLSVDIDATQTLRGA